MKLLGYKKIRKDQLALLLIFTLFWGSISSAFVSQHAEASTGSGARMTSTLTDIRICRKHTSQGSTPVTVDCIGDCL